MNTKQKIIAICIIFLFGLNSISMSACVNVKKIEIISVVSGNSYLLGIKPINVYLGGDFCTFTANLSINEIKDRLTEQDESCELFNDNFLLLKKKLREERNDYLIIGKLQNDGNYQFMSAVAYDTDTGSYVLFPIHLLSITANSFSPGETYSFETDISYELSGSIDSVKSFYESAGLFLVEEKENQINFSLLPNKFVHKHITEDFSIIFEENNYNRSIRIQKGK